jgi:uncharacterized protein (DUF952 family)
VLGTTSRNHARKAIQHKYNPESMSMAGPCAGQQEPHMTRYESSDESRAAGVTYHLIPAEVWESKKHLDSYTPDAFAQDGFIHCTYGLDELVAVGNRYYKTDARDYMALVLDVDAIESPVRYDDPGETFPHIYGPLNPSAIVGTFQAVRDEDGTFRAFTDA